MWKTIVGSKQANSYKGSVSGVAPTITSASGTGGGMIPMITNATYNQTKTSKFMEEMRNNHGVSYRIRKLTPKECFRLMGVDDKDIDTIQKSGVSNSQQYKMAGNSIVVDVLYHIFRKAFVQKENESPQLTFDFE